MSIITGAEADSNIPVPCALANKDLRVKLVTADVGGMGDEALLIRI